MVLQRGDNEDDLAVAGEEGSFCHLRTQAAEKLDESTASGNEGASDRLGMEHTQAGLVFVHFGRTFTGLAIKRPRLKSVQSKSPGAKTVMLASNTM